MRTGSKLIVKQISISMVMLQSEGDSLRLISVDGEWDDVCSVGDEVKT